LTTCDDCVYSYRLPDLDEWTLYCDFHSLVIDIDNVCEKFYGVASLEEEIEDHLLEIGGW